MRVLSIDPGTKSLGWAIIDGDHRNQKVVEFGSFRPKPKGNLSAIASFTEEIIVKYKPDVVVVEASFLGASAKSSFKIGEARAAVLVAAQKHNVVVKEVSPRQAKLSITGNGNASKEQVRFMVKRLFGIEAPNTDSSDAISIGISYLIRCGKDGYNG